MKLSYSDLIVIMKIRNTDYFDYLGSYSPDSFIALEEPDAELLDSVGNSFACEEDTLYVMLSLLKRKKKQKPSYR